MKNKMCYLAFFISIFLLFSMKVTHAQQNNCKACHSSEYGLWSSSKHADTQKDVGDELASNWIGQTPDSVIAGSQAEDCISCHSPTSVTVNGGMTEIQAINYFFSTVNGKFTDSTSAIHVSDWPNVSCITCHNPPTNHPSSGIPTLGVYNSKNLNYDSVQTSNELCGQCHGSLRFSDTDHRIYDAWKMSKHGHGGQLDVAEELASEHSGENSEKVIKSENCIACHAPTSVTMNGGISEAQALEIFFSTENSNYSSSTKPLNESEWPNVSCTACHNPHKPGVLSYYNSSTRSYEVMNSPNELCGQCHGNLRFPDTDHLSYNIELGTGGIDVPEIHTMNAQCIDCHMYNSGVDGSNSNMFKGHSWSIFVKEDDGTYTTSCTRCHSNFSADSAMAFITKWKTEFQKLDSTANDKITQAQNILANSSDSVKIKLLNEAIFNVTYAESDESGGFHNHLYTQLLLTSSIDKVNDIITGVKNTYSQLPLTFDLSQNYPNPFNPETNIAYSLPVRSNVKIILYNSIGQQVKVLVDKFQNPGRYIINFSSEGLASGVYFYRMFTDKIVLTRKMLIL
ncbi:multiheme c-type cytochrome, partial [Melioribacteraceae bacterium 4301-Me]|uniref:multiheme c-type cytochrome n=1 Tax=Pyranulibacter aquaticus TaxID=3163344 RepID=UPI0035961C1B